MSFRAAARTRRKALVGDAPCRRWLVGGEMTTNCSFGDATVTSIEPTDFPLHRAAFENDVDTMRALLKKDKSNVSKPNAAGDTPLHVACMLGNREIISMLIQADASLSHKNNDGWSALTEAISYGNREIITEVYKASKMQMQASLSQSKPHLKDMLADLDDFKIEFKWDFQSWIPLLSRVLPSDVCRVYKKGAALRMDSSLLNMSENKNWERGDITFLYNPSLDDAQQSVVLNNRDQTYTPLKSKWNQSLLEEEIDVLMSADIVDAKLSTKQVAFDRAKTGWIWRQDKSEQICGFNAAYYDVRNVNLVTKKRREHLTAEDIKKNKSLMQKFTSGHDVEDGEISFSQHRRSLSPPPKRDMSFEEYISAPEPIYLGRIPIVKSNSKAYTAKIAMSNEFPLSISLLMDMLEVLAPVKRIHKLREFCQSRIPEGFPVQLEFPIFATISAKITFLKFNWQPDIADSFFLIPPTYKEEKKKPKVSA